MLDLDFSLSRAQVLMIVVVLVAASLTINVMTLGRVWQEFSRFEEGEEPPIVIEVNKRAREEAEDD